MKLMHLPIKCCHECGQAYTLPEWNQLKLDGGEPRKQEERRLVDCTRPELGDEGTGQVVELRSCDQCGTILELGLSGLELLELSTDPVDHARDFPHSRRPVDFLEQIEKLEADVLNQQPAPYWTVERLLLIVLAVGLVATAVAQTIAAAW